MRFYPGAESWTRGELRHALEEAAKQYAARLERGSTADSEREGLLELAIVLGERALVDEREDREWFELQIRGEGES